MDTESVSLMPYRTCGYCGAKTIHPCTRGPQAGACATRNALLEEKDTPPAPVESDAVILPNHYTRFKIEPIKFIMENDLEFWQGNIIKYVMRYDEKNGLEDLKKAARYLEMQIKKMEADPDWNK